MEGTRKTISIPAGLDSLLRTEMEPGAQFDGKSYSEVVRALLWKQLSAAEAPKPLHVKEVTVNRIHAVDSAKLPVYAAIWFAGTLCAAFLGGVLGTILAGVAFA